MEYPVMVDWTSLRLLSVQWRSISLLETGVAEKEVGADNWAADAASGKKRVRKNSRKCVEDSLRGSMSCLHLRKTPQYPGTCFSLPSVTRLSDLSSDPWLCVPALRTGLPLSRRGLRSLALARFEPESAPDGVSAFYRLFSRIGRFRRRT